MYKIKQIIGVFVGIGSILLLLIGWLCKKGLLQMKKPIQKLQERGSY